MKNKKIGIITFHRAINYGAILQTYALTKFIDNYYDVKVIDYRNDYFENMYYNYFNPFKCLSVFKGVKCIIKWSLNINNQYSKYKKMRSFVNFSNDYIKKTCIVKNTAQLIKVSQDMDYIISGSDQVWNLKISNYNTSYLLDFLSKKKSLTYAVSFGKDQIDSKSKNIMQNHIYNFSSYLIRENSGVNLLKDLFDIKGQLVCDPTLLLDLSSWEDIEKKSKLNISNYVLIYLVAEPLYLIEEAIKMAKKNGSTIVIIGTKKIAYKKVMYLKAASPEDFVYLFHHANVAYTTSFHGIMFSIIFNKEFFYELSHKVDNNNGRIIDFINYVDLKNREVLFSSDKKIYWTLVNSRLDEFRNNSKRLLLDTLNDE